MLIFFQVNKLEIFDQSITAEEAKYLTNLYVNEFNIREYANTCAMCKSKQVKFSVMNIFRMRTIKHAVGEMSGKMLPQLHYLQRRTWNASLYNVWIWKPSMKINKIISFICRLLFFIASLSYTPYSDIKHYTSHKIWSPTNCFIQNTRSSRLMFQILCEVHCLTRLALALGYWAFLKINDEKRLKSFNQWLKI